MDVIGQILFSIVIVIVILGGGSVIIYMLLDTFLDNGNPVKVFKGAVTNKEFNIILTNIFCFSKKLDVGEGILYSDYFTANFEKNRLDINGINDFSALQKRKFNKKVQQYRVKKEILDKLSKNNAVDFIVGK